MSSRNYFRPSNGLSEPTGSIRVALKSREQETSSPPCARSAEYFLRPVTVHSIVPPRPMNSASATEVVHFSTTRNLPMFKASESASCLMTYTDKQMRPGNQDRDICLDFLA